MNPFKRIKFRWTMNGKEGESTGFAFHLFRVPVFIPLAGNRGLRRVIKLHKRATRLAEDLHDALHALERQKVLNEQIFTKQAKAKEPPEQTAPRGD